MLKKLKKNIIDFTLGADPEFCCTHEGRVIQAKLVCKGGAANDGKLGSDGNGVSFEVRPDPTPNPLEIVSNIRDIFLSEVAHNPEFLKYDWLSGSYQQNYPLGGHIHFGIHGSTIHPKDACNALSQYLGATTLLIEETNQAINRRKGADYGKFIDYRVQAWGFEYRTPSSWLTSPHVAAGVLCLAKMVMFEMLNNKTFTPANFCDAGTFSEVRVAKLLQDYPKIWEDITKMALYPMYKKHVDVLNYLVTNKLTWFPNGNMLNSWGIHSLPPTAKDEVTLESIWA